MRYHRAQKKQRECNAGVGRCQQKVTDESTSNLAKPASCKRKQSTGSKFRSKRVNGAEGDTAQIVPASDMEKGAKVLITKCFAV